jgi:hypothetical protein
VLQFNPVTGLPRGRSTASRLPVALGLGSLSGLNAPPAQLFGNRGGLGADTSGALAATLGSPAGTITPTVSAPPRTLAVAPPGTAPPGTAPTLAPPASGPDLQRLIESDPLYHQTVLDIDAQRAADKAGLAAQRQGALVQYGAIPDLTNSLGLVGDDLPGEITDTIRQLAQQNTSAGLSTTARLQQAYQDLVGQTKNDLTARGLLSSGETGYQLGRAQLGFTQQQSDALQQLLSTLAGYENGYLGNESARIAALRSPPARPPAGSRRRRPSPRRTRSTTSPSRPSTGSTPRPDTAPTACTRRTAPATRTARSPTPAAAPTAPAAARSPTSPTPASTATSPSSNGASASCSSTPARSGTAAPTRRSARTACTRSPRAAAASTRTATTSTAPPAPQGRSPPSSRRRSIPPGRRSRTRRPPSRTRRSTLLRHASASPPTSAAPSRRCR